MQSVKDEKRSSRRQQRQSRGEDRNMRDSKQGRVSRTGQRASAATETSRFREKRQSSRHEEQVDSDEDLEATPGAVSIQPTSPEPETCDITNEVKEVKLKMADGVATNGREEMDVETTVVAHLAIEEDEIYRQQAEKEAQQKVFKDIVAAEVYDEKKDSNACKYYIIGAVILVLVIVGVVVGVVAGGGGDSGNGQGPSIAPTFAPVTIDPELSKDFCVDAVALRASQTIIGSTEEATADDDFQTCGNLDTTGNGVWYVVEGTGDVMSVSTCGDTRYDTQLSVYTGDDCNALKCVDANDQRSGCAENGSHLTFLAEQGSTYYVLVHGNRRANGIFSVDLRIEGNSKCSSATRFEDAEAGTLSIFGSTKFSTTDQPAPPQCDSVPVTTGGAWFFFEAKSSRFLQARVDDLESRISVYTGSCGSETLQCVGGSGNGVLMWTATAGTEYFLFVHGSSGDFALTLLPGGVLNLDLDAAANVQCESAEALSTDGQGLLSASVSGSTEEGKLAEVPICGLVESTANGIWYSVEGTGNGMVTSTCETDLDGLDTQLSVFVGDCTSLQCVGSGDQNCGNQATVAWKTEPNTQYSILVHGHEGRVGDFNLKVEEFDISSSGECEEATSLTLDGVTIFGSTEGSPSQYSGACGGPVFEAGSAWYTVVGTGEALIASTKFSGDATQVVVHKGGCEELSCANAEFVDEAVGDSATWQSEPGKAYFIQVFGSSFSLSVNELPGHYVCEGVSQDITMGSTVRGTTLFTRSEGDSSCDGGSYGLWYRFSSSEVGTVVASTCSDMTSFNTLIQVFEGDGCSFQTCVMANNGQSCGPGSFVSWVNSPGTEYYILIQGAGRDEVGVFELSIGPENDICEQAIPIPIDSNATGTTVGATMENNADLRCQADDVAGVGPSVWYSVKGSGGTLRASTCHSDTNYDTIVTVYEGNSCQALTCVGGNDNACGLRSDVTWDSLDDRDYYILVHGNAAGVFRLIIEPAVLGSDGLLPETKLPSDGSEFDLPQSEYLDSPCNGATTDTYSSFQFMVAGTGVDIVVDACGEGVELSQIDVVAEPVDGSYSCLQSSDGCTTTFLSEHGSDYWVTLLSEEMGTATVSVDSSNDQCDSAFGPLSIGDSVSGTIDRATVDDVEECGGNSQRGAGVWYSFVGLGRPVTAFTCGDGTDFDTQLSVYEGSSCGNIQCLGGADNNCGTSSWVMFQTTEGEMYHILVSGKTTEDSLMESSSRNFVLQLR